MDLSGIFCFTILSVILVVGLLGLLGFQLMRWRDKLGRRLLLFCRQVNWLRRGMSDVSRCSTSMLRQCLWWTDPHRQSTSSCGDLHSSPEGVPFDGRVKSADTDTHRL